MQPRKPTEHYLKNRDLLRNIHLSKASYTWYIDGTWRNTKYLDYDFIACDDDTYQQCREQLMLQMINNKRMRDNRKRTSILREEDLELLTKEDYDYIKSKIIYFDGTFNEEIMEHLRLGHYNRKLYENGNKRVTELPDDAEINNEDLVLRVFTYSHIPDLEQYDIKKVNKVSDRKVKVNFPPYKHYALIDNVPTCVALSHHNKNKEFSLTHGKIHDKLATGFLKLCQRNAQKYNWKDYSYIEDMQGQALVQLSNVGLQFNELFSSNPFSYYTSVINNAFTVVFNQEKDVQTFRDTMLMSTGQDPSNTKQYENEEARNRHWDKVTGMNQMQPSKVTHIKPDDY